MGMMMAESTTNKIKMFYIYLDESELHVAVIRMIATGTWFSVGKMPESGHRTMAVYNCFEDRLLDAAKGLNVIQQGYYEV